MKRTAIFADGVDIGASALGLTADEVYISNIRDLTFWPYIDATYGPVQGPTRIGLYDRITDGERYNESQISDTDTAVSATADGLPAINMGSVNTMFRYNAGDDGGDFSAGLTVGMVVNGQCGFSAINSNETARLNLSGSFDADGGALIIRGRSIASVAGDYTGPALSETTDLPVLFTLDPVAGQIILQCGSGYTQTLADGTYVGFTAHPVVGFAQVNNSGAFESRFGQYGRVVLWNRALTLAERTIVMNYLESAA